MHSLHSRYAFAALDKLIDRHYIMSMTMTKHYTSENQIEREAERMMDQLDAAYMKSDSDMSLDEYNHHVSEIELWTKLRLREIR